MSEERSITLKFGDDSYKSWTDHRHLMPVQDATGMLGNTIIDHREVGRTFIASTDPSIVKECMKLIEQIDRDRARTRYFHG